MGTKKSFRYFPEAFSETALPENKKKWSKNSEKKSLLRNM